MQKALYRLPQSFARVLHKVAELDGLSKRLKHCLPESLRAFCRVANWRDGCLIIAVSNAAHATQLRYMEANLISTLRRDAALPQLASIKIIINTDYSAGTYNKKQRHVNAVSSRSIKAFADVAPTIKEPALAKALAQLANSLSMHTKEAI